MKDTDLMPFGRYKGIEMANVPPDYLLWLYEDKRCYGRVKGYIQDNLEVIKAEIANKQNKNK